MSTKTGPVTLISSGRKNQAGSLIGHIISPLGLVSCDTAPHTGYRVQVAYPRHQFGVRLIGRVASGERANGRSLAGERIVVCWNCWYR